MTKFDLLLLFAAVLLSTSNANKYKPHILFVVVDDLGSNDLGLHKSGIQTPTIDHLARRGIYLNNYYVLPSCSPTRSAIMTGRYPLHTGIHCYLMHHSTIGLPLDEQTMPQVLRSAGYKAHAVGKWHLGHSAYDQTPTFRGFESFFGMNLGSDDYFSHESDNGYDFHWHEKEFCGEGCAKLPDERGNYSTHVFSREAERVIREYAESDNPMKNYEPLFLYLAFQGVHAPDEVPDHYLAPYEHRQHWTKMRKTYAAMLSAVDEGLHNVTKALKEFGLYDDTLIVFTTDNGGPTETCSVQGSSNGEKRAGKCSMWQGGTTGDGFISGGAMSKVGLAHGGEKQLDHLFHCVDWLPTLAHIAGVEPNGKKPIDGVNQILSLKNPTSATRQELFVGYGKGDETGNWTGPAIRYQHYKLVRSGSESTMPTNLTGAKFELYNLDRDPSETTDISTKYPVIVQMLRKKMISYLDTIAPLPSENPDCPAWHLTNTSTLGPSWLPWCDGASTVVVYE